MTITSDDSEAFFPQSPQQDHNNENHGSSPTQLSSSLDGTSSFAKDEEAGSAAVATKNGGNNADNGSHESHQGEENSKFIAAMDLNNKGAHRMDGGPFPGDDDFDDNNSPTQFVINEWAQGTSIHGVPFVTDAVMWRPWKRAMWVVLVCVSSGFMIWQFTALIKQYRSYEVITDTETINPPSLEFPEVTVCNMNSFSKSRMDKLGIQNPQNEEELLAVSFPLDELIGKAWFNGRELNISEVFSPIIMEWGLCWQYHTTARITRPGFYGGLKIWADLKQYDYDIVADYAGLAVWTQMRGTLITSQLPVYSTKTGQETLISIQKTEFQREKELPWARCKSQAPTYTQTKCRTQCFDKQIVEICGRRRYTDSAAPKSVRYCSRTFLIDEDSACIDQVMSNETLILDGCDCGLPPCSEITYPGYTTDADFSEVFFDHFNYSAWNVTRQYMEMNWVSVTVNYDQIQYNVLTESKAMTPADLLASIGGSMGFFLGISMLSIFELVGDLGLLRLLPRMFGRKHLYGLGAQKQE